MIGVLSQRQSLMIRMTEFLTYFLSPTAPSCALEFWAPPASQPNEIKIQSTFEERFDVALI